MFVDDIPVKNCYYGAIVRSPVAKGVLKSIECPSLGQGWAVIKAGDIPGCNNIAGCGLEVLCSKNISYIGQPLAIIVGPDRNKLEAKMSSCKLEYEEETPVFSVDSPEAAVFQTITKESGSTVKAVPGNETIVEDCYTTGIQEHWVCEPNGAIAFYSDSVIKIFTAAEQSEHVRDSVAGVLSLDTSSVVVEEATLGVTLNGKFWYPSLIASQAALTSFIIKKNVKIVLSRREDILYAPKRAETSVHFRSSVSADGTISETQIDVKVNAGSFDVFSRRIAEAICESFVRSYKLGVLKLKIETVKTNIPPPSPFSDWGEAQGSFVLERHISHIASVIHEDGMQYRYNILKTNKPAASPELIERSDYRRKWASFELLRRIECANNENKIETKISPLRGIGFSYTSNETIKICASCIVEIEIDNIDCGIIIKGIWISFKSGKLKNKNRTRSIILRSLNYSIGWVTSEIIKYHDGKITNIFDFIDSVQNVANAVNAAIFFDETGDAVVDSDSNIITTIFNIFPSSYIEAISQAVNNHIKKIPLSTMEVWNYLRKDTSEDNHNDN
ncbi:hypothetical protein FACS1894190_10530 [Spirochaetia bacterium]|nr:hypothetical protein FACS1894190_10530 [Spirochaetia bacterium]